MIRFDIITIFPEVFKNYFNTSIIKRAQQKGLIKIKVHNLRNWTTGKHKSVDDRPYGGGPGMVLRADVIYRAIQNLQPQKLRILQPQKLRILQPQKLRILQPQKLRTLQPQKLRILQPQKLRILRPQKLRILQPQKLRIFQSLRGHRLQSFRDCNIILTSAAGKHFNQRMAQKFSKLKRIIFICGHYEGIDARVDKFVDEKVSVGPYVLTGGELPVMTIVDAVTRLVPGVIKTESLQEESFSLDHKPYTINSKQKKSKVYSLKSKVTAEYPQYTRPAVLTIKQKGVIIKVLKVPKILLSGNHQAIKKWRMAKLKIKS